MGKKVEPYNKFDLLKSLAHKGDPTAFFTIISPYLTKRYLKERSEGKEYKETVKKLIYEAIEYFSETQKFTDEKFNSWLEENILTPSETAASDNEEVFILENEKKTKTELDAFLNRCNRELMRIAATIKRNKIAKMKKFPHFLYYNKIIRTTLIVVCSFAIVVGVVFIMYWQKLSIKVSFVKEKEIFTFSIPPLDNSKKENLIDSINNVTKDSTKISKNSDTTINAQENKIIKKDTNPTPQAQVKKLIPSPTSAATSYGTSTSSTVQITQVRKIASPTEQNANTGTSSQVKSVETIDTTIRRTIPSTTSPQPTNLQSTTPSETPLETQPSVPKEN